VIKVLSRLVWRRCVLAVFLAGAPVVSWASFTDLDESIGYGDLAVAPRSTDLRSHYDGELRWRLHRLELLRPSGTATPGSSPTASPTVSWGRFGYGWRGHEGEAADGAKLGRQVLGTTSGIDVAASLGWWWSYDAGVRLASAESGRGSVAGGASPDGEAWRYGYGEGDELERIVREGAGAIAELETGIYGRILARDGVAFAHDGAGRRTLDDRFRYRWNWRGELTEVEVLESWPDGEVTPWAGHLIEYRYDASGRMSERWHWGRAPEGGGDRPFIERRVYVWEQARLAAEAAYGLGGEETLRWRRTYVPGPAGLDDAPQVVVEIGAIPGNPYSGTTLTYTYLRDELGTVIGLVAEDEGTNPNDPPIPVRYRYSPYGEAHAESGPRLDAARFVGGISEIETTSGATAGQSTAPDHAAGAMQLSLSLPLDPTTLATGLVVERLEGASWSGFGVELGHLRPPPGTIGGNDPNRAELILLPASGWPRGATYRVRVTGALTDTLGRPLTEAKTLQWDVPAATGDPGTEAVAFAQAFPLGFDTWNAAGDALSGRFPGGQNSLFQGLWTDPVTGIAHARARWYDARNAAWLSEDPLLDVDSVNLYAFVGWGPHAATDPFGECASGGAKQALQACWDYTRRIGAGAVEGAVGGAVELVSTAYDLVTKPGETVKRTVDGGLTLLLNGDQIIGQAAAAFMDASGEERATMIGRLAGGLAFDALAGGAVAKAGKVGARGAARLNRHHGSAMDRRPMPHDERLDIDQGRPPSRFTCITSCFAAGTLVTTPAGAIPIEDVEVGSEVWAYDDQTGEQVLAQVTALHRREVDELWLLTVEGETIETTSEHPFLVVGKGWTEAQYLEAGDLLAISGGEAARLDVVQQVEQKATVYNFEVAGVATYYVGGIGVVVHNCRTAPKLLGPGMSQGRQNAIRGNRFQRQVFESLGLAENTSKVAGRTRSGALVNTEPDLLGLRLDVTEVKDVAKLSFDRQLQAQFDFARQSGQTFNLVISGRTRTISRALQQAIRARGGIIVRYDEVLNRFFAVRLQGNRVLQ
jgi:RHS repeat-associated protein